MSVEVGDRFCTGSRNMAAAAANFDLRSTIRHTWLQLYGRDCSITLHSQPWKIRFHRS